jgi:thiol-disulfide isomerase/thioredoxin
MCCSDYRLRLSLLAVLAAVLLSGCGGAEDRTAGVLRAGGLPAFKAELARAAGRPVVVNQWASWCAPCKEEFPVFREVAEDLRGEVVFLGVDSMDSAEEAERFLRSNPTGFEHFDDPDAEIARFIRGGRSWPSTAFYDVRGRWVFTHQGAYRDAEDLLEDIERYGRG